MANTYSQAYIHLVFAVKNRVALIRKSWKNELEMYITGIVQNQKHKMLAINAMPDHIHIFIGYDLNQRIPDLVQEIKTSSNHWINERRLTRGKFEWQRGYGCFTHSHSQLHTVVRYVLNQEQHHKKNTFSEEYREILHKNEIRYNDEYLFDFFADMDHDG